MIKSVLMIVLANEDVCRHVIREWLILLAQSAGFLPHSTVILSYVLDNSSNQAEMFFQYLNDYFLSERGLVNYLS